MNDNKFEEDLNLIEQYLGGNLSSEKAAEIDQRLVSDADFLKSFEDTDAILKSIKYHNRIILKKHLQSISTQNPLDLDSAKALSIRRSTTVWFASVAAVLLVLVVSLYVLLPTTNRSNKIFQKHFEPYPNVISPIVRGNDKSESNKVSFEEVMEVYELQDYKKFLTLSKEVKLPNKQKAALLFYRGLAYIADNQVDKGILTLKKVNDTAFANQTNWYMALAYIKQGKPESAKKYLQVLSKGKSTYRGKAEAVLEMLE